MVRVIVAGSRGFKNYRKLEWYLKRLLRNRSKDEVEVVCGEAEGADLLGRRFAETHGYEIASFPADWDKHGRSAGYIRNAEMRDHATHLVAFWDGKSKGTKNMIDIALKARLVVRVIRV